MSNAPGVPFLHPDLDGIIGPPRGGLQGQPSLAPRRGAWLAADHNIPAIYPQPQFAYGGGLMSYSAVGTLRQVAVDYVGPILKGARTAGLPIRRPTKFHLIIKLKTAKALGLEVPPILLAIADVTR